MTVAPTKLGYSVRGLANWILDYADSVGACHTNMGLNKLVFFSVEALLIKEHRLLTNAKIEAWEHGPVFREIYQSFKSYGDKPISGRVSFYSPATDQLELSTVLLDSADEIAIQHALSPLIHRTASELRNISHVEGGAWYDVWWYEGHANPGMEITPALILEAAARRKE